MKNLLYLFLLLFLLSACQQQVSPKLQEELSQARLRLQEMEAELEQLKAGPEKGRLVHIVFLHLKEDISEEEAASLLSEIKKLNTLEMANNLEVGTIANTGDSRFISDHHIAFQMDFTDMEAYQIYQTHPTHEAIRENLKPFLSGPPAVYDYWVY